MQSGSGPPLVVSAPGQLDTAALVARVRETRGWSPGALARALGVTPAAVRAWVRSGLPARRRAELERMLVEAPPRLDVRVVRERLGLTQGELAARLRVDRSRVARWERGDHVPAQAQAALRQLEAGAPALVRVARERLGLTQGELARALGVSGTRVSQWEAGRPMPRAHERALAALEPDDETELGPEWIRSRRESRDLSRRQLAKLLGVHAARVGEWEESKRRVPARVHWPLRRTLGGAKARTASRDADVVEVVRGEPGLSLPQLLERFPAHDQGAVQGALERYLTAGRLFRAKGTVNDRVGRPRVVWRFYPEPQESKRVSSSMTGNWLREQLTEKGWTHEALAGELGVTREAVRSWAQRKQQPIPPGRQDDVARVLAGTRPPQPARRLAVSAMPDLREQRRDAGLTQAELAHRLGMRRGQATVSAWERGDASVSETTAGRIADVLAAAAAQRVTAEQLRAGRERAGWTQPELAQRLGVKPARLRRWEMGRSPIPSLLWGPIRAVLENAPAEEPDEPISDLRERREALHWSQDHLAERLGVWQADVSRWERGAPVAPAMRERVERELEAGTPIDPGAGRRAAIVALVSAEPGLSGRLIMGRVGGSWDAVRAELDLLKAGGKVHDHSTPYTDGRGRVRSRPGLYPDPAPPSSAPSLGGEEIVRRREQLGWSQAQLAREMGIAATIVFRWEHNIVAPGAAFVGQLERVFAEGQSELPAGGANRVARVGERLHPVRELLGLSVSAMARRLGVDRGTLADWEAGVRPVSSWRRGDVLAKLDQLEASAGSPPAGAQ